MSITRLQDKMCQACNKSPIYKFSIEKYYLKCPGCNARFFHSQYDFDCWAEEEERRTQQEEKGN